MSCNWRTINCCARTTHGALRLSLAWALIALLFASCDKDPCCSLDAVLLCVVLSIGKHVLFVALLNVVYLLLLYF